MINKLITFNRIGDSLYEVIFVPNKIGLGTLLKSDDGYYYWGPDFKDGTVWEAHVLRAIADKLDELNKEWDDIVQNMEQKDRERRQ